MNHPYNIGNTVHDFPPSAVKKEEDSASIEGMSMDTRVGKLENTIARLEMEVKGLAIDRSTVTTRARQIVERMDLRRNTDFKSLAKTQSDTREMLNSTNVRIHSLETITDASLVNLNATILGIAQRNQTGNTDNTPQAGPSGASTSNEHLWMVKFGPIIGPHIVHKAWDAAFKAALDIDMLDSVVEDLTHQHALLAFKSYEVAAEFITKVNFNFGKFFVNMRAVLVKRI